MSYPVFPDNLKVVRETPYSLTQLLKYKLILCLFLLTFFIPKWTDAGDMPVTASDYAESPQTYLEAPHSVPDKNTNLINAIIQCESHWNALAKNPNSSASGLGQFLTGTWKTYALLHWGTLLNHDVFNAQDNYELVKFVVDNYGTSDWDASAYCWSGV